MGKYDRSRYRKDKSPLKKDDWNKTPAKKNTKLWCKGVVGREHIQVITVDPFWEGYGKQCDFRKNAFPWQNIPAIKERWFCIHQIRCSVCRKILRYNLVSKSCPVYIERFGVEED